MIFITLILFFLIYFLISITLQRDFLWSGGVLEKKTHLVNWNAVCADMRQGDLGIRSLVALNKALLGKWSWKFAVEKNPLRKQVIIDKYGVEDGGWCSREVRGAYGVGVWKAIRKDWENIRSRSRLIVGNGRKVKIWKDLWCKDQALKDAFPNLFRLAINKDQWVCDAWEEGGEVGSWNPLFSRHFNIGKWKRWRAYSENSILWFCIVMWRMS